MSNERRADEDIPVGTNFTEAALDAAIAEEIAQLKRAGYSKAAICERSLEIEDAVRKRLASSPS